MNKPLILYHGACLDGYGAAYAAWLTFRENAEYLPCYYEGEDRLKTQVLDRTTIAGRDIYVLDFSFDELSMNSLILNARKLVWLDHHKTSFEQHCGMATPLVENDMTLMGAILGDGHRYIEHGEDDEGERSYTIVLDNLRCGALLAWDHFFPAVEPPPMFWHIDDSDRFVFARENTREFVKAIWSYAPWSFEAFHTMADTLYPGTAAYKQLLTIGGPLLRAHNHQVGQAARHAMHCTIEIYEPSMGELFGDGPRGRKLTGLAANALYNLHTDVGHALARECGTFGLVWCQLANGDIKVGIRSVGDFDASAVAKYFGGGGHQRAAGFVTTMEQLQRWLTPREKV